MERAHAAWHATIIVRDMPSITEPLLANVDNIIMGTTQKGMKQASNMKKTA
jgi:hypothetical protein